MKKILLIFLILTVTFFIISMKGDIDHFERKEKLSAYQFFEGPLAELKPTAGVVPYDLNTSLFSNYAEKLRFIKLPEGTSAQYNDSTVFQFPIGTILIKNFYYPKDFRNPSKGRHILETRLLVKGSSGWEAFPYLWNAAQTEAIYDPAGETLEVSYLNDKGQNVRSTYFVPNKNQCKGCHLRGDDLVPIGPAARHLNKNYPYVSGSQNQLAYWEEHRMIKSLPNEKSLPQMAVWDNPQTGTVDERARAYLDINCGHCHHPLGPASSSGLFLHVEETDPGRLGIFKSPVAAGRGAGKLKFDIEPGKPKLSILLYRMKTDDPGIAMPEIGREQVHKEGVDLIAEWIKSMPKK